MSVLKTDIKFLKGVGEKRAKMLAKEIGVKTYEDLLGYYPYKYVDRTKVYTVSELEGDIAHVQLKGKIVQMREEGEKFKKRLVATFQDDTGAIDLVWFKGIAWMLNSLKLNKEYLVFGKPTDFRGRWNIAHPEMDESGRQDAITNQSLVAGYHTTERMKNQYVPSKAILQMQHAMLSQVYTQIPESLPDYFVRKLGILRLGDALLNIHFPKDQRLLEQAQHRLKFEELFYIQLKLLRMQAQHHEVYQGYVFGKVGDYFNQFYKEHIPFELTGAQKRVLREIRRNVATGKHMNRLIQGDVGSGKTMVALLATLLALDNGYQAALMAPTEILATQHYETISEQLAPLGVEVELLTGSTRKKKRREIHEGLLSGKVQLLIGTHALIEDVVQFSKLGLVVIDEQHRFGVAQRARLWMKYDTPPHVVVMTATPIPRTLAMTLYGDLDVSIIDELPPGRKPVKTTHMYDSQRLRMFGLLKDEIKKGRQVYIVYPLIDESEKLQYKALNESVQGLSEVFPSPEYPIGILHGRMKPDEKELAMQYFVKGMTKILVATTVIEVGVNVPNASVMVIENAEKFGLSQLHQLRGRVGRGSDQSFCILMTPFKLTKDGKTRLKTMVNSTDGFELAEVDLKLRGPGDLEGTIQSGLPVSLKIANLVRDGELLTYARNIARRVIDNDPTLAKAEHAILRAGLQRLKRDDGVDWAEVS